jgi:putative membrane protein
MKNTWKIVGTVVGVLLVLFLCVGSFGMLRFARFGSVGTRGTITPFTNYYMMGGVHPLAWVMPLIVLAVIVVGIVLFIVWFVNQNSKQPSADAPVIAPATTSNGALLDVLKMRYAKGEITKEQFDSMKQDLGITQV